MIYLDNSATTPVKEQIGKVVYKALTEEFGNPSSLHGYGIRAEKKIDEVRDLLKKLMGVKDGEIIFTSGGTESNNLAIFGVARRYQKEGTHIITSQVEHPSVLNAARQLEKEGFDITYLPVDETGRVNLEELKKSLRDDTILITIQYVNNEIGTIQPLKEIGEILQQEGHHAFFHTDAVQGLLKLPVIPEDLGVHLLSFSGHKFHAPKGIGGLYIRKGTFLTPLMFGGGQEFNLRSGTENVPGILGLGKALELNYKYYKSKEDALYEKKEKLCNNILENYNEAKLIGPGLREGSSHILSLGFRNFEGEVLLRALEEKGVYVSTGSACASRKKDKSPVLESIGLSDDYQEGVIRFSLSYFNSLDEIEQASKKVVEVAMELEKFTKE
ncbi:cysteine desulfurase family protein [Natranaerofaba carboxydovora]|uniref:cysteine desulfurase family protein n=1 Tax=Natranaerofaba carboxydovora TaxID=2742683 RepID=UPI001F145A84|nr:cysteine desulfurase family protein [Natranaerofaba carboxydovora]UMZ75074.1 Cysteine desulfurase IscS [Natranaerofaba carboxydovora]